MDIIDQYFKLQNAVYAQFGYDGSWEAIPVCDSRDVYWNLAQEESGSGIVHFDENKEALEQAIRGQDHIKTFGDFITKANIDMANNSTCIDMIYTPKFLEKWVYRTDTMTMICIETPFREKFLKIYDNSKEI